MKDGVLFMSANGVDRVSHKNYDIAYSHQKFIVWLLIPS